ncbi:MAG: DNA alkylation repair protein [Acidiferrobacterales bacterium]
MPEPLKNLYNKKFINSLASEFKKVHKKFNPEKFSTDVFADGWRNKELKARMRHITLVLNKHLPDDYSQSIKIMKRLKGQFSGFEYMFLPDYVELFGLDSFETSVVALEHFTSFASSEFAVRPFIKKFPDKMMRQMYCWAKSENYHVRRLASEGCRPRLPWAMALPEFKKNPKPVIKILEKLKSDESEYVRRSVANNLNDISRDHPELVASLAKKWLGQHEHIDGVVKHGCRTLLKNGHREVLKLFGFAVPGHIKIKKFTTDRKVRIGQELLFSFFINTDKSKLGKLRIEYVVDFVRSNNKSNRKVFKISEGFYSEKEKIIEKKHSFRKITTRKYYPGTHSLALIINGREMASKKFQLDG